MSRGNSKRKRPVYVVVKPLGIFDEDGEEVEALIGVRQTRAGAEGLKNATERSIVRKALLVDD